MDTVSDWSGRDCARSGGPALLLLKGNFSMMRQRATRSVYRVAEVGAEFALRQSFYDEDDAPVRPDTRLLPDSTNQSDLLGLTMVAEEAKPR
jgi:hypothetical protein